MFKRPACIQSRRHNNSGGDWTAFPIRQLFVLGMFPNSLRPILKFFSIVSCVRVGFVCYRSLRVFAFPPYPFFLPPVEIPGTPFLARFPYLAFDRSSTTLHTYRWIGMETDSLTSIMPYLRANCVHVHFPLCLSNGRIVPRDR